LNETALNFAHPAWALLGLAVVLGMLWSWRRHDQRQRQALEQFVAPHLRTGLTLSLSARRRTLKRALFAAAVLLAFAALAQPQAGFRWETFTQRGNDILFAVDTSRSMSTPDVKPSRLERAKLAIDGFVDRLNGDAVGLVAFAGNAFIQTPLTVDYGAFRESLAALDVGIVPRGGTNITSAIHAAQQALHDRPGSDKILILVTDGEDLEGDSLAAAKAASSQDGLKIYTVGVGSANGDLIPLPQEQGGGFLKDSAGQLVKSRLDETALKALAAATGGIYAPLGAGNRGLDTIYEAAIAPLAKHAIAARAQKIYTQRFQWPLGAAIVLLLASLAVGTRRNPRAVAAREAATRRTAAAHGVPAGTSAAFGVGRVAAPTLAVSTVAALLAIAAMLHAPSAQAASPSAAAAAAAYAHGDYATAAKDYAAAAAHTPQQPLLEFNAGAAAYKAGSYETAAHAFQASVDAAQSGTAKRLADQEDAYYNLGNTLYREGEKTRQSDAQQTIATWTQSLKAYDAALELRPDDADDKFNRDLVKRKLDALKKQQQQQQQQQQSKQDQSKATQSAKNQANKPDQPNKPDQSNKQGQSQPGQSQPGQPQGSSQANASPQGKGSQAPQQAANNPTSPGGTQPSQAHGERGGQTPVGEGASPGSPGAQVAQNNDDQRTPGGMSREEARELLDSVKDAKQLPPTAADATNSPNIASPDEPQKDW